MIKSTPSIVTNSVQKEVIKKTKDDKKNLKIPIKNIRNSNLFNELMEKKSNSKNLCEIDYIAYIKKIFFSPQSPNSKSNGTFIFGLAQPQNKVINYITNSDYNLSISKIAYINQRIGLERNDLNFYGNSIEIKEDLNNKLLAFISSAYKKEKILPIEPESNDLETINYFNDPKNQEYIESVNKLPRQDLIFKWSEFLSKNQEKVDIFQYVNNKKATVIEKNKIIEKLILKNTTEFVNQHQLEKFITDNNIFSCKNMKEARELLMTISNNEFDIHSIEIFNLFSMIQNHFFRNTSKLGLDFFNDNNVNIVMAWNTNGNQTISLDEVNNKPYKKGIRRTFSKFITVEPITYSEIRYINKNTSKFSDNLYRIKFDDDKVSFSSGLKNKWHQYNKEKLIS